MDNFLPRTSHAAILFHLRAVFIHVEALMLHKPLRRSDLRRFAVVFAHSFLCLNACSLSVYYEESRSTPTGSPSPTYRQWPSPATEQSLKIALQLLASQSCAFGRRSIDTGHCRYNNQRKSHESSISVSRSALVPCSCDGEDEYDLSHLSLRTVQMH